MLLCKQKKTKTNSKAKTYKNDHRAELFWKNSLSRLRELHGILVSYSFCKKWPQKQWLKTTRIYHVSFHGSGVRHDFLPGSSAQLLTPINMSAGAALSPGAALSFYAHVVVDSFPHGCCTPCGWLLQGQQEGLISRFSFKEITSLGEIHLEESPFWFT